MFDSGYNSRYIRGQKEKFVSINEPQGSALFIQEELDSWMGPYIGYLTRGEVPEDKREASLVQRRSFPEIVVWKCLNRTGRVEVLATKTALLRIVNLQYFPRFLRFIPLASEVKKTAGVFSENALLSAMYYLIWYMLASHITGSVWYLLAIDHNDTCWKNACKEVEGCNTHFLYCGNSNKHMSGYEMWKNVSKTILKTKCFVEDDSSEFNYGIFSQAIQSDIVASIECYCLWWSLQNLSTYPGEVMFSIVIAIMGLILFALLIGNMQIQKALTVVRLEEMRIKRCDSEQWMHHRLLPQELRERVRRYDQYKWLNTRGVDEESLVQSLPKDLRRDIKRHLCLNLVRRGTYIVREGDPVNGMLFIIRGRLESVTTDGGRSGFFNRGLLKEADFCGEELLTWALDPKSAANLPSSTRTVKAINEVESFAFEAEEFKFVASQFSLGLGTTVYASRFAANALRHHRLRGSGSRDMIKLQKPPEPDFSSLSLDED
uniref:Cyclic nucleotide-gated ion channel 5 n=1 Tax=Cajanus cajan TaxID=3821 RepID=A0A151RIS1_CAJCA|nr:putative cyclic nucleotide-gated ion channel 5 [Cajanus cajan]